jgi:hypothetical protein
MGVPPGRGAGRKLQVADEDLAAVAQHVLGAAVNLDLQRRADAVVGDEVADWHGGGIDLWKGCPSGGSKQRQPAVTTNAFFMLTPCRWP